MGPLRRQQQGRLARKGPTRLSLHPINAAHLSLTRSGRGGFSLWTIGIVFKSCNLSPNRRVEENVSWRLEFHGIGARQARAKGSRVLEEVAIEPGARRRVAAEFSGGKKQRVAIA